MKEKITKLINSLPDEFFISNKDSFQYNFDLKNKEKKYIEYNFKETKKGKLQIISKNIKQTFVDILKFKKIKHPIFDIIDGKIFLYARAYNDFGPCSLIGELQKSTFKKMLQSKGYSNKAINYFLMNIYNEKSFAQIENKIFQTTMDLLETQDEKIFK